MDRDRKNLLKGYNLLLYFAGSMVMHEPTEECIIDFWINGKLKKLPVSSSNPRFIKAAGYLRDSCQDNKTCRDELIKDFRRLFSVTGLPLAPAYSSTYPQKDGIAIEKVNEFYNSYGFQSNSLGKIPDDHLGIELLFLTRLIDNYLALDDNPSCREMQKEICRFINVHLLSWIPQWNMDIQNNANTLCYKGIGTLIHACIEDIDRILA